MKISGLVKYQLNMFNNVKKFYRDIIIRWPNTLFGENLRRNFYNKKLNTNLKYVGRGCEIDRTEAIDIENNVILGDNVKLIISGMSKCYIGDSVGIADGVYIRSANHNFSNVEIDILEQGHTWNKVLFNNKEYGIVIERNIWIGARAIILSGAHIGEGSVIAAGAVVSSKVPPFSIVVGNPGRVVGNRKIKNNIV